MDLLSPLNDPPINLLHRDGIANYHGILLPHSDADAYLNHLLTDIAWRHDEAIIFGKHMTTRRKVAWYAEQPFQYSYSRTTKTALPWSEALIRLKAIVEKTTGHTYNACLLNLYHHGEEGVGWHSDDEKTLKKHAAIASLSFGAERKFAFKHKKTRETTSLILQHGSLLVMKGTTQHHWLHRLPSTKSTNQPRVNLTFRTMDC